MCIRNKVLIKKRRDLEKFPCHVSFSVSQNKHLKYGMNMRTRCFDNTETASFQLREPSHVVQLVPSARVIRIDRVSVCAPSIHSHVACVFRQTRAIPAAGNSRNDIVRAEVRERDEKWEYESLRFRSLPPVPFSPRVTATSHPIPFASLLAVTNGSNARSRRSRMCISAFRFFLSYTAGRSTRYSGILAFFIH